MRQEPVQFATPLTHSSPYFLGEQIADLLPGQLHKSPFDRCFLVTSRKLFELFGRKLARILRKQLVSVTVLLVGDGEPQKSWRTLERLGERLVRAGATKDSMLLALGGGVVGNLVGMTAALLYRGIRFVEIPTTIMALTDSTLSNKQAVNGRLGKNLFGVYYAPEFIWGDVDFAASEPVRQQRAGVVEGIKNIFIAQHDSADAEPILDAWDAGDTFRLTRILIDSKLPILRSDPSERGSAVSLEYGHTFGHAIEWLAAGRLFHGEAISIGMCLAAELSHALGETSDRFLADHYHLLGERLGAPTRIPDWLTPEMLMHAMQTDNKRSGKGLGYLLLADYGRFVNPSGDRQTRVPADVVLGVLERTKGKSLAEIPPERR